MWWQLLPYAAKAPDPEHQTLSTYRRHGLDFLALYGANYHRCCAVSNPQIAPLRRWRSKSRFCGGKFFRLRRGGSLVLDNRLRRVRFAVRQFAKAAGHRREVCQIEVLPGTIEPAVRTSTSLDGVARKRASFDFRVVGGFRDEGQPCPR